MVLWASSGRRAATALRAETADLRDVGSVDELSRRSELIVFVCPPDAALDVARSVSGFEGIFVDVNAVSPATARAVAAAIETGGGRYVDGGIVGPPPWSPGTTRLYLSGPAAQDVAGLFASTVVDARVVSGRLGAASALKMAYAAWTKGTAALLLAIRRPGPGAGRGSSPAGGVEHVGARSAGAVASRRSLRVRQGVAVGRRDAGDRLDVRLGRSAGGVPSRGGRDLPQSAAARRRSCGRPDAGAGPPCAGGARSMSHAGLGTRIEAAGNDKGTSSAG